MGSADTSRPPRWDLTPLFPSLDSSEIEAAMARLEAIADLEREFDARNIRRRSSKPIDETQVSDFERLIDQLNRLLDDLRTLSSYLGCWITTEAGNERAQTLDSQLRAHLSRLDPVRQRFVAWIGTSDTAALLERSAIARDHAYFIEQAVDRSQHQMSEAEEALAARLNRFGIQGWARLHGEMSALLTARVERDGREENLAMSEARGLATHRDRSVRRSAFDAEISAWESVAAPFAAALNGIKGSQRALRERRTYVDDLEPTLAANGIDREILEAMQTACVESFPRFEEYHRAKAAALGTDRLAWYDLAAPIGPGVRTWSWEDAEAFIVERFGGYSDRLAQFARRAFRERWIDAEPRFGKEGGAYCTGVRPGESRVMMNFDGSFNSVSTLAHELGHAYHNANLADRTALQRSTPSTLAETASIFCETLAFSAAVRDAGPRERLSLLDTVLQRDAMVVVDIHSRFLFEQSVFSRVEEGSLTVCELNGMMTDAQRATYGEVVEPLHPLMWAVKGHYYGPTFYNYPYTFGLLFGLGLYARYQEEPDRFQGEYDDLLGLTGMASARDLGRRFNIDVGAVEFWRTSLSVIEAEIEAFVVATCPDQGPSESADSANGMQPVQ